jgi:hypothetical protein
MAQMSSPTDPFELAVAVLPTPPATVAAMRSDHELFAVHLIELRDGRVNLGVPPRTVTTGDDVLLCLPRPRGGYDVECRITELFYASREHALAEATVSAVYRRRSYRAHHRGPLDEPATVTIIAARDIAPRTLVEVRLTDVSEAGIAFLSQPGLKVGDLVMVAAAVLGEPLMAECRVRHITREPFGRVRVGCELTAVDNTGRSSLATAARATSIDAAA